jgi:hypothetical protein
MVVVPALPFTTATGVSVTAFAEDFTYSTKYCAAVEGTVIEVDVVVVVAATVEVEVGPGAVDGAVPARGGAEVVVPAVVAGGAELAGCGSGRAQLAASVATHTPANNAAGNRREEWGERSTVASAALARKKNL